MINFEKLLSIGLAICLLFALGAGANALNDALSTDPDEVIDVDYASLPFGEDDAGQLRDAVTGEGNPGSNPQSSPDSDPDADDGDDSAPDPDASDPESDETDASEDPSDEQSDGGSGSDEADSQGEGEGLGAGERSLLDRLLALLGLVLPYALILAALVLLFATRGYLASLIRREPTAAVADADPVTYVGDPQDEVSAAWYAMVRDLGMDQDVARTPRECERAAAEAGADPSSARTLTDLYEQIRYGGQAVTDDRVRRAREALRGLHVDEDELADGPDRPGRGRRAGYDGARST